MTNVSVGGEFIEFEQSKLSASKLAKALLNSAIDRAFSQLLSRFTFTVLANLRRRVVSGMSEKASWSGHQNDASHGVKT